MKGAWRFLSSEALRDVSHDAPHNASSCFASLPGQRFTTIKSQSELEVGRRGQGFYKDRISAQMSLALHRPAD